MKKIVAVARKEVRQISRDPLSLLMLLGLPAFMLVLYGFALSFDVRHVGLAVQDHDKSPASRALVNAFVQSGYFDLKATPEAGEDLEHLLASGRARGVLVIPRGYGDTVAAGQAAPVQLLLDGADAGTAGTVLGYAGGIVSAANNEVLRRTVVQATGRDAPPGIEYRPRVWFNPDLSTTKFLVPGLMGMLLMLSSVLATALSVVREKERATMEQLRMAPLRTLELILGKTLPYLAISLAAAVIILVAARLLFGVEVQGSYLALFVATFVYLLGALGLGLLISTVADSQAMAFQAGLLVSLLPAVLLSGFIFQIRAMPAALQVITYLVPARHYLVVLRGVILKGTDLGPYPEQMAALMIFALVTLALASLRLVREGA